MNRLSAATTSLSATVIPAAAVVLAAALVFGSAAAEGIPETSCTDCHADPDLFDEDAFDLEEFAEDVHAEVGLSCQDCHGGNPDLKIDDPDLAMDPDFTWPQVWNTNLAIDQLLPWDLLGTFEILYGKDLNAVFMRNADLVAPVRTLPDGRPYYGGFGANELNDDGGAGIYVLDNTSEGSSCFRQRISSQ